MNKPLYKARHNLEVTLKNIADDPSIRNLLKYRESIDALDEELEKEDKK